MGKTQTSKLDWKFKNLKSMTLGEIVEEMIIIPASRLSYGASEIIRGGNYDENIVIEYDARFEELKKELNRREKLYLNHRS